MDRHHTPMRAKALKVRDPSRGIKIRALDFTIQDDFNRCGILVVGKGGRTFDRVAFSRLVIITGPGPPVGSGERARSSGG